MFFKIRDTTQITLRTTLSNKRSIAVIKDQISIKFFCSQNELSVKIKLEEYDKN